MRCTYVLPDGITHTKGFVKDPDEAKRYLTMTGGVSPSLETKKGIDQPEVSDKLEERKRTDLSKNVSLPALEACIELSSTGF